MSIDARRVRQTTNLGALLRTRRFLVGADLRDLAKEIGIGATTLMRIEHGRAPNAQTFVALLNWLMAPARREREE